MGGRGGASGIANALQLRKQETSLKRQIARATREFNLARGAERMADKSTAGGRKAYTEAREKSNAQHEKIVKLQEQYDTIQKRLQRFSSKRNGRDSPF